MSLNAESERFREVLKLHLVDGQGIRAIARATGISRDTVRRILGIRPAKTVARVRKASSLLDPHREEISRLLKDVPTIKATTVLERLRLVGYSGGLTIIRELLRSIRPKQQGEAFGTLHFAPGAAVQVDWADFGFCIPGSPRRVSGFVMAMCYSRKLYLEFTQSQSMGSFLRCMERALHFFEDKTTEADIFDNMKTVVQSHSRGFTVFNQRFLDYASARGFAAKACNVRKGNEKGRVERPIGFVRSRFWPGRHFASLLDINRQAAEWRDTFCNGREHEATGKVPALVFEHEEKALLRPVKLTPFDADDLFSTTINKSFRVTFDRNTYSTPFRLVQQQVLVRGNDEWVSIYLGPKRVAVHRRSWDSGKDFKQDAHEEGLLEQKPRARAGGLPPGLAGLQAVGDSYFKQVALTTRSLRQEIVRITLLVEFFGDVEVASAIDEVMRTGHVGGEYVEFVLRHKRGLAPSTAPLRLGNDELDSLSLAEPDLARYDDDCASRMTKDPGPLPTPPPTDTP